LFRSHRAPSPPSSFNPALDSRLDALCLRTLSKEPAARPSSVEAFLRELAKVVPPSTIDTEASPPEAPVPSPETALFQAVTTPELPRVRPRRGAKGLALAGVFLVSLAGVWWFLGRTNDPNGDPRHQTGNQTD